MRSTVNHLDEMLSAERKVLKYDPNGAKPGDVWDILPEDTQKRNIHFAPYPEDLCRIPILATCPKGGCRLGSIRGYGNHEPSSLLAGPEVDRD